MLQICTNQIFSPKLKSLSLSPNPFIFLCYARFYVWVLLPLAKELSDNLTKKRNFHKKPQTASKFEENRNPKTLWNRKPHIKPHFKGTKTANRAWNRVWICLKPRPATHCTPQQSLLGTRQSFLRELSNTPACIPYYDNWAMVMSKR